MSIAQHDTVPSGRGALDFTAFVGPLRLSLGVIAVLALVGLVALEFGAAPIPAEADGGVTLPDSARPSFDGRGKWSGYAR